jgi:Integrase core domain
LGGGAMSHSKEKIQLVKELHKPARKNYKRRRTIIKGIDDLWQSDLCQLDGYAKDNKNYKFILVVIDCFSKFVWCKPLKSKSGEEVAHAFEDILKSQRRRPLNLQTDQGREYFNVHFQKLMKQYCINHYNTYSHMKAAIAERVIRTLKERLFKYFSLNGTHKWFDVLPNIVQQYNDRKHRTTGVKPSSVNKKNEQQILKDSYTHIKMATGAQKFKINDVVRISKAKHVFEKGYVPNWTTELFKVVKVKLTNPITYLLEDLHEHPIKGCFYTEELQKAHDPDVYLVEKILRKKGDKVYVRWLGFNSDHDSWIDASNQL